MVWLPVARATTPDWEADSPSRSNYAEDTPWVESAADLPVYPEDEHLVKVPTQIEASNLTMFIDERTLTVGEDGVVRYTLVLRSPSGAENVFFEGMRCATRELRSYAYGTSRAKWQPVDTAWAPFQAMGAGRYRELLYQYYLCRPAMGTLPREEILQRLRYGVPRND